MAKPKGELGKDIKEFYNADWDALVAPGLSLYLDMGGALLIGDRVVGTDYIDLNQCEDNAHYRLDGVVQDQSGKDHEFSISLQALYRRWKGRRDTVTISIKVPKVSEIDVRAALQRMGVQFL